MRKENDDVGPKAELDHWKKRLARFDSLTACVKSPQCRNVVSILVAAKSKVLKVFILCAKTPQLIINHLLKPSGCYTFLFTYRLGRSLICRSQTSQMRPKIM